MTVKELKVELNKFPDEMIVKIGYVDFEVYYESQNMRDEIHRVTVYEDSEIYQKLDKPELVLEN